MLVKNCCVFTGYSDRNAWTRVTKWKAIIMGKDGLRGSCGKKALHLQIFIVGYLQFVDRQNLQAAPCSTGCGASELGRELHRWPFKSGTVTSLSTGSVKPPGNSQEDGSVV
jgi:hypothetical protein